MKIYLAEPSNDLMGMPRKDELQRLRVLFSYHYFKNVDVAEIVETQFAGLDVDLFADSGAFSAFAAGIVIDDDDYIAWVNRWKKYIRVAAGPDVIGNAPATQEATERMLDRVDGIPVLPVFHVGEPWEYLTHWVGKVDYMALGGMVPYTKRLKLLSAWIAKAWTMIPETMRVHGFGLTTWPLLIRFPWYSVDSSSWTAGFRYAQLQLFDERKGRMTEIKMRDRTAILRERRLLQSYGLRGADVHADTFDRVRLVTTSVCAWQRAEEWLVTNKKRSTGLYLVISDSGAVSSP